MSGIRASADYSAAFRKTEPLMRLGEAARRNLTDWATDCSKALKVSAASMNKSGRKTGQLSRSIGFKLSASGSYLRLTIGTGMMGSQEVKYASIQDKGGDIIPRKRKWLTVPLPGVKGAAWNYNNTFVFKSKGGNLIIAMEKWKKVRGGENYARSGNIIPLFVLKKRVHLPGTAWFSKIWEWKAQFLRANYMNDRAILETAQKLAGTTGG